ncbi:MAG: hypothetical protein K0S76_959 [Herbinix sp.]|nr:hypothetical protein [Herbinix sp.]
MHNEEKEINRTNSRSFETFKVSGGDIMITIFNRKRLLIDISQVECNRVKQILKTENIEYYYKTVLNSPMMSRRMDVSAQAKNAFAYREKRDHTQFVYYIYVKRKDHKRARKLAYGN